MINNKLRLIKKKQERDVASRPSNFQPNNQTWHQMTMKSWSSFIWGKQYSCIIRKQRHLPKGPSTAIKNPLISKEHLKRFANSWYDAKDILK